MNSPVHFISQVINSFWLALITTSLALLSRELYLPDLLGRWFFLVLGLLLLMMAFVPNGYARFWGNNLSSDTADTGLMQRPRSCELLFKANAIGVVVGALTVFSVRFVLMNVLI